MKFVWPYWDIHSMWMTFYVKFLWKFLREFPVNRLSHEIFVNVSKWSSRKSFSKVMSVKNLMWFYVNCASCEIGVNLLIWRFWKSHFKLRSFSYEIHVNFTRKVIYVKFYVKYIQLYLEYRSYCIHKISGGYSFSRNYCNRESFLFKIRTYYTTQTNHIKYSYW